MSFTPSAGKIARAPAAAAAAAADDDDDDDDDDDEAGRKQKRDDEVIGIDDLLYEGQFIPENFDQSHT